jgi:hypothetical protein
MKDLKRILVLLLKWAFLIFFLAAMIFGFMLAQKLGPGPGSALFSGGGLVP